MFLISWLVIFLLTGPLVGSVSPKWMKPEAGNATTGRQRTLNNRHGDGSVGTSVTTAASDVTKLSKLHAHSSPTYYVSSSANMDTNINSNTTSHANSKTNSFPNPHSHSMGLQSTPDPFPISPNTVFNTGALPQLFKMTFSLTLPSFDAIIGDTNIFDIQDAVTARSLLKLDRTDVRSTVLSYDTVKLYSTAAETMTTGSVGALISERTYFTLVVQDQSVTLTSSLPYERTASITGVSTNNKIYVVYVSNAVDTSSGGDVSDFSVTGRTAFALSLFVLT